MLDPPDAEIRPTRLIQDVRAMVRSWTDAETGMIPGGEAGVEDVASALVRSLTIPVSGPFTRRMSHHDGVRVVRVDRLLGGAAYCPLNP
jgi:hypothetical protein